MIKMEAETDKTRRRHGQMKNTLKLLFGRVEGRYKVKNQDLVRNLMFELTLENENTRFLTATSYSGEVSAVVPIESCNGTTYKRGNFLGTHAKKYCCWFTLDLTESEFIFLKPNCKFRVFAHLSLS
jgi:hypothetical protein